MLRKPPEMLDEFSVSAAFISPYSAKLADLGNITDSIYNSAGQGVFHNGYVLKDHVSYTDTPDDKTYSFKFTGLIQVSDSQGNPNYAGNYLKLSSVKAEATTGTFEKDHDSETMLGMEVDWTHYFDSRRRFGFVMGLNNAGFSFAHSTDWEVRMTADSYLYHGSGLEGRDGFTGSFYRPIVCSPERPEGLHEHASKSKSRVQEGQWAMGTFASPKRQLDLCSMQGPRRSPPTARIFNHRTVTTARVSVSPLPRE